MEAKMPPSNRGTPQEEVGPVMMTRLRDIVRPKGRKGLWMRELTDSQLAETYLRLKRGAAVYEVCSIAQRDFGVKRKSTTRSLCRAMTLFAKEVIGEIPTALASTHQTPQSKEEPKELSVKGKRIVKKLDGLGTLAWVIEKQLGRFEMSLERESTIKMPLKHTDVIVKRLFEGLAQFVDHSIKLGLVDAKTPELSLKVKHLFDGVMKTIGDDSGQKVIAAGQRFLELAAENALTLVPDECGSYRLEDARHAVPTRPVESATAEYGGGDGDPDGS
jgi:hypothetical protein